MKYYSYLCTQNWVRSLAAPQQFNELIAFGLHRLCHGKSKSVAECQCMRREKRLLEALQVKWQ